jgi:hypothetical protein
MPPERRSERNQTAPKVSEGGAPELLQVGCASVAIRRFVYHSWYEPAEERPKWQGPTGKVQLDRDQLFA